jgi:hypothetical protein
LNADAPKMTAGSVIAAVIAAPALFSLREAEVKRLSIFRKALPVLSSAMISSVAFALLAMV